MKQTPLRRTSRKSLPNSMLVLQRQMMRDTFLKSPITTKKRSQHTLNSIKRKQITKAQRLLRKIKTEPENKDDFDAVQKVPQTECDSSPKTEIKVERNDDRLEMPETFSE